MVAWRGHRQGHYGVVECMNGIYYYYIRWDDGELEHYKNAALTWPQFLRQNARDLLQEGSVYGR